MEIENGDKSIIERRMNRKSRKCKPKFVLESLRKEEIRRRTSLMWESENDPFQVFEVEHESCLDLEIMVKHGEGITKGSAYQDLIDTPDPYVILRVPGSSNSSKRTSHIDNTVHPMWNETFHFYLDPNKQHVLQIILMDANFLLSDEPLGENTLDVNSLLMDETRDFVIKFTNGSVIHLTIKLQKDKTPDLRFSLALCEEEKKFLRLRRQKVMKSMQELIGEKGPKIEGQVPVVAILGSGGGFRAMTCLSGAVKALHKSGILACSTYIAGLSGSSWLISTLYSHDKFPDVTYDEIYEELRASVTHNWKWNLKHGYSYVYDMIRKFRGGQPVSFTDIFGHLLGDVLLQGQKSKKLSEQRSIVELGTVPFPLYTCLHAKAAVSCKTFSEWIEFSPYEIGIAKYGTFMKTEDFGSKFIVGKLIKKFPEFPLHYLQGVWGSAFTILMKRLALTGTSSNKDLVQMMRDANEERAINEQLEKEYLKEESQDSFLERDSESDDETDIEGADDKLSEEDNSDKENNIEKIRVILEEKMQLEDNDKTSHELVLKNNNSSVPQAPKKGSQQRGILKRKGLSFEFPKNPGLNFMRKLSKDESNSHKMSKDEFDPSKMSKDELDARKLSSVSDPGIGPMSTTNMEIRKSRIKRQGAIREGRGDTKKYDNKSSNYWSEKREQRKTRRTKNSSMIQDLFKNSNILNSRVGRAGEILNPFRGLSLKQSFPLSPFDNSFDNEETIDEMDLGLGSRYESLDNKAKKLFIVDSGLAFNSPYPLLLRPQRAVDIYLSFDFSQRPSDRHMPFKELLIAETWAKQNKVPFPPIKEQISKYEDDPVQEFYIFKNDADPLCPVILHFTIVNNKFKWEKAPGVRRTTQEELEFADFSLFDEPLQPYASTNFVYEPIQYERLVKLIEFNTLLGIDSIKEEMALMVEKKRKMALTSVDDTFLKVQKLMKTCKKFRARKSREQQLQLKIDENEGIKYLNVWRRSSWMKTLSLDDSSRMMKTSEDEDPFYDAYERLLDSCEEESDYETDDGEENTENNIPVSADIEVS